MPKSLDTGVSARVPVKVPAAEKQALIAVLRDGETLSALTRELWRKEVARRLKARCRNPLLSKDFTATITE
jgi:hypothetical protein